MAAIMIEDVGAGSMTADCIADGTGTIIGGGEEVIAGIGTTTTIAVTTIIIPTAMGITATPIITGITRDITPIILHTAEAIS